MLLPTFTYRKGLVYKQEAEAQAAIAQHGLYIDRSICLHFTEKQEERSDRPLIIKSTVVLPDDDSERFKTWKSAPAFKDPVVAVGPQLRTKDLVIMDDVSIDALPPSIEADTHATQPEHTQPAWPSSLQVRAHFGALGPPW